MCRDGTLKNQPNKMGTTPQHIYCASLADSYTDGRKKKEERRKVEDRQFALLATRRSVTLAMLSSKVNGPIAHESTW